MEGVSRRRPTLSDHMAAVESSTNLRDLLMVRDDDRSPSRPGAHGLTLGSVIGCEKPAPAPMQPPAPSRTLLDIIREEESSRAVGGDTRAVVVAESQKINWKSFKDRLRLRRTGAAWSSASNAESVAADFMRTIPRAPAHTPPQLEAPRAAEERAIHAEERPGGPVRVSLLTLLEQADRHAVPLGGESDSEEEEAAAAAEVVAVRRREGEEGGEYVCCVCMVRHKGAAFIPCGHTFCRLCSRELWVSRGNCPLCNGYILEILDIF